MLNTLQFFKNITKIMAPKYYAVAKGRNPGIYNTWDECKTQVTKFAGPVFKKFHSQKEAEDFVNQHSGRIQNNSEKIFVAGKRTRSQKEQSSKTDVGPAALKKSKIVNEPSKIISVEDKAESGSFTIDSDGYVNVYTDGACSSNGKKGAKAGIGVWFGDSHPLNVSEPVVGRATNNMAEIQAVSSAAKQAKKAGIKKLKINTDSQFLISCINNWMPRWKANGWKTANKKPVINKTELLEMEDALKSLDIAWNHVNGHVGIHGNEMADKLAREGCLTYK